ncbi:GHKL domain-containing protein [Hymenobacter sp. RP-2-7]|uniref:histidine kinase n=1 Tax=Hymenobacter polaris TaxID=2682546 RepID=A0A7Y0AC09_9BACT|nr:ATP-binding protein [Hymenobacter polaris]NML64382.1 GHKL domain-containing protein [Hymenobacter polaris]
MSPEPTPAAVPDTADDDLATLAGYPLFAQVPRPQLAWLLATAERQELAAGQQLHGLGDPVDHTHVVLHGELRLFDPQHPGHGIIRYEPGQVSGYLPFSRMTTAKGVAQAVLPSTILALPRRLTQQMAAQHFELTQALVGVMTTRVRETTAVHQQNERMVALGKLSAGLAHELNNPIGAVASAVGYLSRHTQALPDLTTQLLAARAAPEALGVAQALFAPAAPPAPLGRLARATLEEDLADWLLDHDVPQPEALAEQLAEVGCTEAQLAAAARQVPAAQLALGLQWAYHGQQLQRLAADAREAAGRVAELVRSIKTYTHMDQSPAPQAVDLNEGLRTTCRLLAHKFREAGVQLQQELDPALPLVLVLAGELNQVWTNLLDNALDALRGQPGALVRVASRHDPNFVQVTITDNGPGIPTELQSQVFMPFFTTKPPGQGTGLGLDLVQRITRQHGGAVRATSRPGYTEFEVCLPRQAAVQA